MAAFRAAAVAHGDAAGIIIVTITEAVSPASAGGTGGHRPGAPAANAPVAGRSGAGSQRVGPGAAGQHTG